MQTDQSEALKQGTKSTSSPLASNDVCGVTKYRDSIDDCGVMKISGDSGARGHVTVS